MLRSVVTTKKHANQSSAVLASELVLHCTDTAAKAINTGTSGTSRQSLTG
jgi:hypothetical protein